MSCVAAVLATVGYKLLTQAETDLAETQFESIADRALTQAAKIARQRRWSLVTLASIAAEMNPNASAWPFVTVTSYERFVQGLLLTSDGKDMGFAPFVTAEQQADFEDFAYAFYEERFPNQTVGISSFGKGIWARDNSLGTSDNRYHVTAGNTTYASPNNILVPILHVDEGVNPVQMLDAHFEEKRGTAIDGMIECSRQRATVSTGSGWTASNCGAITSFLSIVKYGGVPGVVMYQPIFPANDPTTVSIMTVK
jgi:hypothetical protein